MARTVKVDFTGVESGGSRNVRVPEGDYLLEITKIDGKKGKESGKPNLIFYFKLSDGPKKGNGKELQHNCSLQKQSLWNLKNILEACGKTVPSKSVNLNVDNLVGLKCAGNVIDGTYNDRLRSEIAFFYTEDEFNNQSSGEEVEEAMEEAEEKPASKKGKKEEKKGKKGKKGDDMFGGDEEEATEEESTEEEAEEEQDDLFN